MAIRINEPAHYRLIKACAQKAQLRSAAKKGKAYRRLTETELDDIASGATVYFVEYQRSSRIQTPHQQCNCEACLEQLQLRAVVSAYAAARRSRADYVREKLCDGKHVNATDTDEFDELWETEIPAPRTELDTMLSALKDDRQRRLAELLANQATMEQISEDTGYKSWSAVTYAKRKIKERLASYTPEYLIMGAVREALETCLRYQTQRFTRNGCSEYWVIDRQSTQSEPIERDNDNRDDIPAPRRAKDSRPVDIAINAPNQTPNDTLYVEPIETENTTTTEELPTQPRYYVDHIAHWQRYAWHYDQAIFTLDVDR